MSTEPTTHPIRTDLDALPKRMLALPIDERGYPVPWFVEWIDGKPEFRAMDSRKFQRAIRERLCWVCGQPLGVNVAFVAGPMCGINRISAEPPSHRDCAQWSALNCPFLSNPEMTRRPVTDLGEAVKEGAGLMLKRNPGVAMLWLTRSFEVMRVPRGPLNPGMLIVMGEPERVEWYRERRRATRDEVLASVESGFPVLLTSAQQEPDKRAVSLLLDQLAQFQKYLPEE